MGESSRRDAAAGREEVGTNLTELLSLLAHDLRNPLSAVLTNLNFLRGSLVRPKLEQDEAILDSTLSCTILERLIANLDLLARASAREAPQLVAAPLEEFVTEVLARARLEARAADVDVEFAPSAEKSYVMVEPGLFGRALDNLVANAIQYSPVKGKIQVTIVRGDGAAAGGCDASWSRIEITDEGPVIPPDLRGTVLTARGQGISKTRFDARYGRGLGLFCAALAGTLAGGVVSIGERDGGSLLALSGPSPAQAKK